MTSVSSTAFGKFASDAEDPLSRIRAELFACHHMLDTQYSVGVEVQEAVDVLIVNSLERVDRLIRSHTDAFKAYQRERAA